MKSQYRAVIIGGGVVGASVLYHLTKFGWTDIALIERAELTAGSTWHAAAGFHPLNADPNIAALQAYTIKLYKEIEEESGQAVGVQDVVLRGALDAEQRGGVGRAVHDRPLAKAELARAKARDGHVGRVHVGAAQVDHLPGERARGAGHVGAPAAAPALGLEREAPRHVAVHRLAAPQLLDLDGLHGGQELERGGHVA